MTSLLRSVVIWAAAIAVVVAVVAGLVLHDRPSWAQPVESAAAVGAALLTAVTAVAAATSASTSAQAARLAQRAIAMHSPPRLALRMVPPDADDGPPTVSMTVQGATARTMDVVWSPPSEQTRSHRFARVPSEGVAVRLDGTTLTTDPSGISTVDVTQLEVRIHDRDGFDWMVDLVSHVYYGPGDAVSRVLMFSDGDDHAFTLE